MQSIVVVVLVGLATYLLANHPRWHEKLDESSGSVLDHKILPSSSVMYLEMF